LRDANFLAEYAEDVQVFRPPATEPVISGKAAFSAYYATTRFNLPNLHGELAGRMVVGNKVIDHERITGAGKCIMEAVAVYEVVDERIQSSWFFSAK
jgi:hypothetical protein